MKRSDRLVLIFVGIGVAAIVLTSVFLWFMDKRQQEAAAAQPSSGEEQFRDAWFECKIAVLDRLKNPDGADFPWRSDVRATRGYDGTFTIRSYVDATNGFGAVVRTPFVCEAKPVGISYITTVKFLE